MAEIKVTIDVHIHIDEDTKAKLPENWRDILRKAAEGNWGIEDQGPSVTVEKEKLTVDDLIKCQQIMNDKGIPRICIKCGDSFYREFPNQKNCQECGEDSTQCCEDAKHKTCKKCGKEFEKVYRYQRYCGDDCKDASKKEVNARWRKKHTDQTAIGTKVPCKLCGKEFQKLFRFHLYCGAECSQEANRLNKAKYRKTHPKTPRICSKVPDLIPNALHKMGSELLQEYADMRNKSKQNPMEHVMKLAMKDGVGINPKTGRPDYGDDFN